MKTFLCFFSVLAIPMVALAIEEQRENPEDLVRKIHQFSRERDYGAMVRIMHPYTLEQFKAISNKIIQAAIRKYSDEAVLDLFPGVDSLEKLNELRDDEYWVYVMGVITSDRKVEESKNSVRIVGKIEDQGFLYVFYHDVADLEITTADDRLIAPRVAAFRRSRGVWKYYNFDVGRVEWMIEMEVYKTREKPSAESGPGE